MTADEWVEVSALLQAVYHRTDLSTETIRSYGMLLADLDTAAVQKAVVELCQTSKWLPTVAEIRAAIADHVAPLLSPGEAWERALKWAEKGAYGPPPPRTELWGAVTHALGLGRMTEEPIRYLQPRFLELYREMAPGWQRKVQRGEIEAWPPLLLEGES